MTPLFGQWACSSGALHEAAREYQGFEAERPKLRRTSELEVGAANPQISFADWELWARASFGTGAAGHRRILVTTRDDRDAPRRSAAGLKEPRHWP